VQVRWQLRLASWWSALLLPDLDAEALSRVDLDGGRFRILADRQSWLRPGRELPPLRTSAAERFAASSRSKLSGAL